MNAKTVIIANRRANKDYWEGCTEKTESEAQAYITQLRSLTGAEKRIIKTFADMTAYRADAEKKLDAWEKKRKSK